MDRVQRSREAGIASGSASAQRYTQESSRWFVLFFLGGPLLGPLVPALLGCHRAGSLIAGWIGLVVFVIGWLDELSGRRTLA